MKKIYISIAALAMSVSACITQSMAAASPSVTVENDSNGSVSYTYSGTAETKEEASKLFGRFSGVTSKEYSTQNLTVTSSSRNNSSIDVYLKLEAEPVSEDYSLLNYYTFTVSDQDGNVIYENEQADVNDTEKVIPLGLFNEQFTKDVKKFKVDYKIDEAFSGSVDSETLSGLTIYVASMPVEADTTGEITAAAVSAPAAATEAPAASAATAEPAAATAEATAAPEATPTASPQSIVKVCGEDISEGRYVVSGNGVVLIKSSKGEVKSETTVTDGTVEGVNGVKEFVATLSKGDQITMTALPGMEKPSIKFEKTNTSAASTKTTAKPATTASKTNAAKTNPKTGEGGVPVAILSVIMMLCAAAVGGLEFFKRRSAK